MRAVIYARYSSENQRAASIEDQLEVCRRFIDRQNWTLGRVYKDAAMSGSSRFRPDYQKLLNDLDRHQFDIVVVEALDRLGRKLADVADLHDRCAFAGVKLVAVNVGEITAMHVGLLGTMAQLYIADLREKTWRGQLGRALQGKAPGGKAYGYDVVDAGPKGATGERRINEVEAAVVQRILREFADGRSPRDIAKQLNAEGVAGPGGRPWGDTTIRGQAERSTGILNNALYVGRLEWNRCSYIKDPRTGKRTARPNPREKLETAVVPHLRIVDDALWDRVKARQEKVRIEIGRDADGNALNRAHRRKFLLSELLVCGECGGGYAIMGKDRYGCATRRGKGTCGNRQTITRQTIEARVLRGLKDTFMAPEFVAEFIRAFQEEVNAAARTATQRRGALQRDLDGIERKMVGVLKAIEDGMYSSALKERMRELETRKSELLATMADAAPAPAVVLYPNLPDLYRRKVAELERALDDAHVRAEAAEILRSLIDKVVLTPASDAPGGLAAALHGDIISILSLCDSGGRKEKLSGIGVPESQLSVVAGRGFEPLTFRL